MVEFVAYPAAVGENNVSSSPRCNLRKLNFVVNPPGPLAGQKRNTSDEDKGDEEHNRASLGSVAEQRRQEEDEYTATIISAIRDFYVIDSFAWLKQYYHSAVARLQQIKDARNIAAICSEIELSLQYWASWHAEQFVQNLTLNSEDDCAAFLDSFTLALANWSARATKLRTYFAWVELEYRHRERRGKRGIIDLARKAIDSHFVRNRTLWSAVNTAVDKLTVWSSPLRKDMLDRVILLERVYAREVRGLPINSAMANPLFQDLNQSSSGVSSSADSDLTTAVFSPVLSVLRKGAQYASVQVSVRRGSNMLEDWAARANFWTARITAVFNYLLQGAQLTHLLTDLQSVQIRPEWHTSHRYLEESLHLLLPEIAAYALGLSPNVPQLVLFLQSAGAFNATQELLFDRLALVMHNLTEQVTSLTDAAPIVDRIHMLGLARTNLTALCNKQKQNEAEVRLTKAMQEAVKANAGPLLVQLRHAVQHGWQHAPLAELRNLNLNLTPEDSEDDEIHARMLAEDVAVDLLPISLGGSAVDPQSELKVLTTVAGDFRDRGVAFTWMPLVMAAEAAKLQASTPILLHYVAWLAARDPLLTTSVPEAIARFIAPEQLRQEVKWHPSWSIVNANVGGSAFDCSVVQFDIIAKLVKSSRPVPESLLVVRRDGEPEEAPLARRAALLDLVKNSDGFIRFSQATIGTEYAIDANNLPTGSLAIARFVEREES